MGVLTCLAPVRPGFALAPYVQVSAGTAHTVGLREDGTVWAWGGNRHGLRGHGVLGDGSRTSDRATMNRSLMPVAVKGGVISGLRSFQHDTSTQTVVDFEFPESISEVLEGIRMLAAGHHFSLALAKDGKVWAWGSNAFGQLGDGSDHFRFPLCRSCSLPIPVRNAADDGHLTGIVAVAAGNHHSLALADDGTVWAWGVNTQGQLGDGTTEHRSLPARVISNDNPGGFSEVIAVAAGATHSVALKKDGTVWAWGSNAFGQLGDGTKEARLMPAQTRLNAGGLPLREIAAVSAGQSFTAALHADGRVLTWGNNSAGQLGDGTRKNRSTPMPVKNVEGAGPLTAVSAISVGRFHVVALQENGTVVSWGLNSDGQLGNREIATALLPVPVSKTDYQNRLEQVTGVSAGYNHTAVVREDGTIWSWGGNGSGQLGDNTTIPSALPVLLREMPQGMFEVEHGEGRWIQLTSGGRRNPGRMVPAPGEVADAALRHYISAPPDLSGLAHRERLAAIARSEETTLLDFTPVTEGFLTVSFDARVSSAASRTLDIRLIPEGSGNEAWFLVWGRSPGKVFTLRAGDIADIGDEWRRYAVSANLDERTYDVWVDGEQVAGDVTFRYGSDRTPVGTPYGRLLIGTTHGHNLIAGDADVVDGEYADIANIHISAEALENRE